MTQSTSISDLKDLVVKAQSGDRDAAGELYCRFHTSLYATMVKHLGGQRTMDAEDVVQEAFILALRKIRNLEQPKYFGTWLHKIAFRVAANISKKTRNVVVSDMRFESLKDPGLSPDEHAAKKELSARVLDAFAQLRSPGREAMELFYLQGLGIPQIQQILDRPKGTVKRQLFEGRCKMCPLLAGI